MFVIVKRSLSELIKNKVKLIEILEMRGILLVLLRVRDYHSFHLSTSYHVTNPDSLYSKSKDALRDIHSIARTARIKNQRRLRTTL